MSLAPRTTLLACSAALALLSGCGGGDDGGNDDTRAQGTTAMTTSTTTDTTPATPTPTQPTATTTTGGGDPKGRLLITQRVRAFDPGGDPPAFEAETDAKPGQVLQIQVRVRGAEADRRLVLRFDKGPGDSLRSRARVGDRTVTSTIRGKGLRVASARYVCVLGNRSFCPVETRETEDEFVLTARASRVTRTPLSVNVVLAPSR